MTDYWKDAAALTIIGEGVATLAGMFSDYTFLQTLTIASPNAVIFGLACPIAKTLAENIGINKGWGTAAAALGSSLITQPIKTDLMNYYSEQNKAVHSNSSATIINPFQETIGEAVNRVPNSIALPKLIPTF